MDSVSIPRLHLLHPAIRERGLLAYENAVRRTPVNVHPLIVQTLRTFEEQDLLYQKGRTRPGPIVTKAKPGSSWHQYGLALDFCLLINGKMVWNVDKNWMLVVAAFKEQGFTWGGDWKGGFKDYPHLEVKPEKTLKEMLVLYKAKHVDHNGYVLL